MNTPFTPVKADSAVALPAMAGPLGDLLALQADPRTTFPNVDYRREMWLGLWILLFGFGGFLLWAIMAPLDGGVPAPGVMAVESTRKTIDHPAGGIIDEILVREGQSVEAGQELIVLNEVQARSSLNATFGQWHTAQAMLARLLAERDGAAEIRFPQALMDAAHEKDVADAVKAQQELFLARRGAVQGELRIIDESVRGLESQLESLSALRSGREKQVALFREQLGAFQKMAAEGFVSRNYLLEVERQLAEVQTRLSEDLAKIADVSTRLAEYRMRGAQRETEYRREVESQLTEVQRDAATLGERLAAQHDTVNRLVIRSPVAGTVVSLAYHTIGGVVRPGDPIMELVPQDDLLIVEARVAPQYIDRVHAGLPADVHFDAYSSRVERPMVSGRVEVVSADALTDPRTGASYYTMRIRVAADEVRKLGDLRLQPGMQSTVMVKTGEASLMVYLLRPLLRRFTTAMAE